MSWLVPVLAGAATGVLSGFGVGGGTLLLIYMTAFAGVEQHLAQASICSTSSPPPPLRCPPT